MEEMTVEAPTKEFYAERRVAWVSRVLGAVEE